MNHPITPDGRYFVVRGRLWRMTNPSLDPLDAARLTRQLMDARRSVKAAKATGDPSALADARHAVDTAKIALGERGPPWWTDGAPDFNRRLVRNTPYRAWFEALSVDATHHPKGPGRGD